MTVDTYDAGIALQNCERALRNIDPNDQQLVALYEIAIQDLKEILNAGKFYDC